MVNKKSKRIESV